jgi:hypothetical protein
LWSDIPLNILTSDILVPVYGAYDNLVVSSVDLKSFNHLGSSSSYGGYEFVGMCDELFSVFGAEVSYICFNCGYL